MRSISQLTGNEDIKHYLTNALEKGMVGNSLLFAGPQGAGKEAFAIALAMEMLCQGDQAELQRQKIASGNHPDLHCYRPEGKTGMHSIQTMRQLSDEVYLPPYESEHKIFIVYDADRMLPYSANALLKTFEEPALDTIIILISSAPELLLPTICSRCRTLHFKPGKKQEDRSSDPLSTALLALLTKGKLGSYSELAETAKALAQIIESRSKLSEETLRTELMQGYTDKLTASQRESIDKEIDGALAIQTTRESKVLFDGVLAWYRDLLLLSVGGDQRFLFYPQAIDALQKAKPIPLQRVFDAIESAKVALARSTTLHLCVESLLLKLNFI